MVKVLTQIVRDMASSPTWFQFSQVRCLENKLNLFLLVIEVIDLFLQK